MTFDREKYIKSYIDDLTACLKEMRDRNVDGMVELADILLDAKRKGRHVFLMGNGGSASTASHFASDLAKGTLHEKETTRFKAISLADNIPLMLAWANDASYDDIFVEQLKNLLDEGDVVIGISGSGNSPNILKALEYANAHGATTVGLTGRYLGKVGKIKRVVKFCLVAPTEMMQQIEDMHILLEHMLTSMLREESASRSR